MTAEENQKKSTKDVEDPIKSADDEKPSKFLRVITVSAYVFSVSFAALMLSLYYIFIWNPEKSAYTTTTHRLEGDENIGMPDALTSSSSCNCN